jgi:cytochrome b
MAGPSGAAAGERRWDPLIRLTHWSVAAAVLLNGLIVDDDSLAHVWIGYVALALLALRLLWGVIGTAEARFSAFPPSLGAARTHVQGMLASRRREYLSHNPLGALMAYALWGTLLVVSLTGVMLESSPFPDAGVAHADEHEERSEDRDGVSEAVEEIHEAAANLLLLLAALHVGGVALESRLSGVNLVRAMVTGVRPAPPDDG